MLEKRFKVFPKSSRKLRKYNNIVEAAYWSRVLRRVSGTTIREVNSVSDNHVRTSISKIGSFFFIFWNSLFFYCSLKAFYEDQTILRTLYDTKLKRYGDDYERIICFMYTSLSIFLIAFKMNGNPGLIQSVVDIDVAIEKLGDFIDFAQIARVLLMATVMQFIVYFTRLGTVSLILYLGDGLPLHKMYQVAYGDAMGLFTSAVYCYFVMVMRQRYQWVNSTLQQVYSRSAWEYKLFSRGRNFPSSTKKIDAFQVKQICSKLKSCAKIYSMLYATCNTINSVFGVAVLITILNYINYIILYLFYVMEATATGLFRDVSKYLNFMVYTTWVILFSVGSIYHIVYFSERVVTEAKKAHYITHQIINEDMSTDIKREALELSLQILHQTPVFTASGFFKLDYAFLQEATTAVITYLVVLLQFATRNSDGGQKS